TRSALDDVQGLGPARKARLVKELGGVRALRAASLEDLVALAWLPDAVGRAVHVRLHGSGGRRGIADIRVATGENIET
ncbi:MAG: excinuclease ABC subunit UvrC, partial [Acidimicrobiales bacterium]